MVRMPTVVVLAIFSNSVSCVLATEPPVAGVDPHQRPAGAPVITHFQKSGDWYGQALHGVSQPFPASLRFLENQGAWHTPFNRPGMAGPYDLRGWHRIQETNPVAD